MENIEKLNDKSEKTQSPIIEKDEENKGKWLSIWATPREVVCLMKMKTRMKKLNISLSFSQILRAIANKGWNNLDLDAIAENPALLFQEG